MPDPDTSQDVSAVPSPARLRRIIESTESFLNVCNPLKTPPVSPFAMQVDHERAHAAAAALEDALGGWYGDDEVRCPKGWHDTVRRELPELAAIFSRLINMWGLWGRREFEPGRPPRGANRIDPKRRPPSGDFRYRPFCWGKIAEELANRMTVSVRAIGEAITEAPPLTPARKLSDCQTDCLEMIRQTGERMKTDDVIKALETAGKLHGKSTIKQALASLVDENLLVNEGKGRGAKGYGLPEWETTKKPPSPRIV